MHLKITDIFYGQHNKIHFRRTCPWKIFFEAISPFEKISPRSTITMELAGRLLTNWRLLMLTFPR